MNYWHTDYVMSELLAAAQKSGCDTLTVDMLTGTASPDALLTPMVRGSVAHYVTDFPRLVTAMNATMDFIQAATMRVSFDLSIRRPSASVPGFIQSPFVCTTDIVDDRGKSYSATVKGWW